MEQEYVRPAELAKILGVHPRTIMKWAGDEGDPVLEGRERGAV
jgi:phage terminase Nu1 subunit (DNA packaging protein)